MNSYLHYSYQQHSNNRHCHCCCWRECPRISQKLYIFFYVCIIIIIIMRYKEWLNERKKEQSHNGFWAFPWLSLLSFSSAIDLYRVLCHIYSTEKKECKLEKFYAVHSVCKCAAIVRMSIFSFISLCAANENVC